MKQFIPSDVKEMTEKYLIDKGGICGQSCLAVIEKSSINNVLENWIDMGLEWKGWSGWKQLRKYLENRNYKVKQVREINSESLFYIARVQWIGEGEKKEKPFYGWGHWTEASAHTHFIVIDNKNKCFFCNEDGWFNLKELKNYLDTANGLITSYLKINL